MPDQAESLIARWSGEAAVIFFSTRGVINGPSSTDCTRLAACRRFPVVIVLNQGAWGKSQLGDWLPQKRIGRRKKCIALLHVKLKSPAEWVGLSSPATHGHGQMNLLRHVTVTTYD